MAKEEVKRFNSDLGKFQKLIAELKEAGSDIDNVIAIVKKAGYNISLKDIEELKAEEGSIGVLSDDAGLIKTTWIWD
jgi:hypothetical protein